MPPQLSRATDLFLELYGVRPGPAGLSLLGDVSARFSRLPWENLTKYLTKHRDGARRRLSTEVLEDHARLGSGGTCFSLTNALRRIVTDLGFASYPVMADMRHGANVHCGLLVDLDGRRFLLDPGYLVPEPVSLRPGETTRIAMQGQWLEYRAVEGVGQYEMHTINERGEDVLRYRLRPQQVPESEFARHWLESFESTGMNGLHLNRIAGGRRLSAHDLNLRVDDGRDKLNIKLRDGYVGEVSDRFGLHPDLVGEAYGAWKRTRDVPGELD